MKFGEPRPASAPEPRAGATRARVFALLPQRWRLLFGETPEPVWIPSCAGAAAGAALSCFIRNPLKARLARALLRASDFAPQLALFPQVELPTAVRNALSFELPITAPWQALIRISNAAKPPHACALFTTASGVPVAYARAATMPSADGAIHAETEALARMGAVPALAGEVPRLVSAGRAANGRRYVVMSVAPPTWASRRITPAHVRFLAHLSRAECEIRTFRASPLRRRLTRALLRLEPALEHSAFATLRAAFERCGSLLEGWEGPFVYAHGDFTPEKVRLQRESVFVHGWSHARSGANPLGDLFHFLLAPRSSAPAALCRAIDLAEEHASRIHPEWTWPRSIVSAFALAYLVEAILERCLERRCFDPADARVSAYWPLLELQGERFPPPRSAFRRFARTVSLLN